MYMGYDYHEYEVMIYNYDVIVLWCQHTVVQTYDQQIYGNFTAHKEVVTIKASPLSKYNRYPQ